MQTAEAWEPGRPRSPGALKAAGVGGQQATPSPRPLHRGGQVPPEKAAARSLGTSTHTKLAPPPETQVGLRESRGSEEVGYHMQEVAVLLFPDSRSPRRSA